MYSSLLLFILWPEAASQFVDGYGMFDDIKPSTITRMKDRWSERRKKENISSGCQLASSTAQLGSLVARRGTAPISPIG